jgi:hypothetical protein
VGRPQTPIAAKAEIDLDERQRHIRPDMARIVRTAWHGKRR